MANTATMTTSPHNIITTINSKYNRFRNHVYSVCDNLVDPSIMRLRMMSAADFIAGAQLLIKTEGVAGPADMEQAILRATGLEERFVDLRVDDKQILRDYCAYFYEIATALST